MSDLISRQAAIEALGEEPLVWTDTDEELATRNQWQTDVDAIKAVPLAEPKKGKWINRQYIYSDRYIDMKVCIHCQYEYSYDAETGIQDANFCPNCGADMRGK